MCAPRPPLPWPGSTVLPGRRKSRPLRTPSSVGDSGLAVSRGRYDLGNCHYYGQGMVADFAAAFRLYTRAAEQGFAEAMKNCGDCHYCGEGVEEDLTEAVRWYRKAAEQDSDWAQFNLGNCCEHGKGSSRISPRRNSGIAKLLTRGSKWRRMP